jgi:PAS domain-containing protein
MARSLSELLKEIAGQASSFDEPVLSYLCQMAALEANNTVVPVQRIGHNLVGMWDWDVSNDLTHSDPNCAALFGIASARARKGLSIGSYLKAVHPDDVSLLKQTIANTLNGGIFEAEYRIITNSNERWVFAKGYCTLDRWGRPERFPGMITELVSKLH